MAGWWRALVAKVWDWLLLDDPLPRRSGRRAEVDNVDKAVEKARAEWQAARLYFENVTDPELIDHAIFSLEAAERKYMYLLRQAEASRGGLPRDAGGAGAARADATG